jgi:hypothetical protein
MKSQLLQQDFFDSQVEEIIKYIGYSKKLFRTVPKWFSSFRAPDRPTAESIDLPDGTHVVKFSSKRIEVIDTGDVRHKGVGECIICRNRRQLISCHRKCQTYVCKKCMTALVQTTMKCPICRKRLAPFPARVLSRHRILPGAVAGTGVGLMTLSKGTMSLHVNVPPKVVKDNHAYATDTVCVINGKPIMVKKIDFKGAVRAGKRQTVISQTGTKPWKREKLEESDMRPAVEYALQACGTMHTVPDCLAWMHECVRVVTIVNPSLVAQVPPGQDWFLRCFLQCHHWFTSLDSLHTTLRDSLRPHIECWAHGMVVEQLYLVPNITKILKEINDRNHASRPRKQHKNDRQAANVLRDIRHVLRDTELVPDKHEMKRRGQMIDEMLPKMARDRLLSILKGHRMCDETCSKRCKHLDAQPDLKLRNDVRRKFEKTYVAFYDDIGRLESYVPLDTLRSVMSSQLSFGSGVLPHLRLTKRSEAVIMGLPTNEVAVAAGREPQFPWWSRRAQDEIRFLHFRTPDDGPWGNTWTMDAALIPDNFDKSSNQYREKLYVLFMTHQYSKRVIVGKVKKDLDQKMNAESVKRIFASKMLRALQVSTLYEVENSSVVPKQAFIPARFDILDKTKPLFIDIEKTQYASIVDTACSYKRLPDGTVELFVLKDKYKEASQFGGGSFQHKGQFMIETQPDGQMILPLWVAFEFAFRFKVTNAEVSRERVLQDAVASERMADVPPFKLQYRITLLGKIDDLISLGTIESQTAEAVLPIPALAVQRVLSAFPPTRKPITAENYVSLEPGDVLSQQDLRDVAMEVRDFAHYDEIFAEGLVRNDETLRKNVENIKEAVLTVPIEKAADMDWLNDMTTNATDVVKGMDGLSKRQKSFLIKKDFDSWEDVTTSTGIRNLQQLKNAVEKYKQGYAEPTIRVQLPDDPELRREMLEDARSKCLELTKFEFTMEQMEKLLLSEKAKLIDDQELISRLSVSARPKRVTTDRRLREAKEHFAELTLKRRDSVIKALNDIDLVPAVPGLRSLLESNSRVSRNDIIKILHERTVHESSRLELREDKIDPVKGTFVPDPQTWTIAAPRLVIDSNSMEVKAMKELQKQEKFVLCVANKREANNFLMGSIETTIARARTILQRTKRRTFVPGGAVHNALFRFRRSVEPNLTANDAVEMSEKDMMQALAKVHADKAKQCKDESARLVVQAAKSQAVERQALLEQAKAIPHKQIHLWETGNAERYKFDEKHLQWMMNSTRFINCIGRVRGRCSAREVYCKNPENIIVVPKDAEVPLTFAELHPGRHVRMVDDTSQALTHKISDEASRNRQTISRKEQLLATSFPKTWAGVRAIPHTDAKSEEAQRKLRTNDAYSVKEGKIDEAFVTHDSCKDPQLLDSLRGLDGRVLLDGLYFCMEKKEGPISAQDLTSADKPKRKRPHTVLMIRLEEQLHLNSGVDIEVGTVVTGESVQDAITDDTRASDCVWVCTSAEQGLITVACLQRGDTISADRIYTVVNPSVKDCNDQVSKFTKFRII